MITQILSEFDVVAFLIGLLTASIFYIYQFIRNCDDARFFSGTWRGILIETDELGHSKTDELKCSMVIYDKRGALSGLNSYSSRKNNGLVVVGSDKLQDNTNHFVCSDIKLGCLNIFPKIFGLSSRNYQAILFRNFNVAFRADENNKVNSVDIDETRRPYEYKFRIRNRYIKPRVDLEIKFYQDVADRTSSISGQLFKIK